MRQFTVVLNLIIDIGLRVFNRSVGRLGLPRSSLIIEPLVYRIGLISSFRGGPSLRLLGIGIGSRT